MQKVYKKLTRDQKDRGVIFSSTLSTQRTEQEGDTVHEVTAETLHDCAPGTDKITLLSDDKFFQGSPWKFNIIRR